MRLDSLLSQSLLFCDRASRRAKLQAMQRLKASPALSSLHDALQAWVIERVIRPESATELAQ